MKHQWKDMKIDASADVIELRFIDCRETLKCGILSNVHYNTRNITSLSDEYHLCAHPCLAAKPKPQIWNVVTRYIDLQPYTWVGHLLLVLRHLLLTEMHSCDRCSSMTNLCKSERNVGIFKAGHMCIATEHHIIY